MNGNGFKTSVVDHESASIANEPAKETLTAPACCNRAAIPAVKARKLRPQPFSATDRTERV
jgi:hypothetical protein